MLSTHSLKLTNFAEVLPKQFSGRLADVILMSSYVSCRHLNRPADGPRVAYLCGTAVSSKAGEDRQAQTKVAVQDTPSAFASDIWSLISLHMHMRRVAGRS